MAPSTKELNTWVDIALHLKVSVRTAQNWEKELGLPVKRITEGPKGRVLAMVGELDHWKQERLNESAAIPDSKRLTEIAGHDAPPSTSEESIHRRRWMTLRPMLWIGGILSVLGLVIAARIGGRTVFKGEPIAHVKLAGRSVEAVDANGHNLWIYPFAQPFAPEAISYTKRTLADFTRVVDLRGDGEREVLMLAPFKFGPNPSDPATIEIICFSGKGDLLWSFVPTATFQFGEHVLGDPWNILEALRPHE
jgi:hypothetical protein